MKPSVIGEEDEESFKKASSGYAVEDVKFVIIVVLASVSTFLSGSIFTEYSLLAGCLFGLALFLESYILIKKNKEYRKLNEATRESLEALNIIFEKKNTGSFGLIDWHGHERRLNKIQDEISNPYYLSEFFENDDKN